MRTNLPLNFGWRYTPAFDPAMVMPDFDASALECVDIPHTCKELPLNYFDERDYQFVSGYRKEFSLPREMKRKGNRFLLHFEGVANAAKVYLNGAFLGEHKGGYTAFTFDVTETVKTRGNVLAVEVDSTEREEIPPFGRVVDYLCYGGIYREVWLECVNEVYIADTFIRTKDLLLGKKKLLDIDVTFSEKTQGDLKLALYDGEKLIASRACPFEAKVLNLKWRSEEHTSELQSR